MPEDRATQMDFAEFRKIIGQELMIDEDRITPESSFFDDLWVDSIRMVEMMFRLEDLGISIPLETAWEIRTVGDAYRYYVEHVSSEPRPAEPRRSEAIS